MNLSRVDMNLLKVLSVLIEERSVTRTGARLGRTQSAVSNALNRLRRLLDDDLLVRSQGGMALTPRAEALRRPLKEMMDLAETCLDPGAGFDPATAEGVFRIAMPDRLSLPVLPPLVDRLRRHAPGTFLHVMTADQDHALRLLDDDRIELALGSLSHVPPHVTTAFVFDDELVCLCRRGHPLMQAGAAADMDMVLSFPHLVVSAIGGRTAIFDTLLSQHGMSRRPLVSVSSFSTVPPLLERSDMVGVFTRRIATEFAQTYALAVRKIPLDLVPLDHRLMWHTRYDRDQKHLWLRSQLHDICRQL